MRIFLVALLLSLALVHVSATTRHTHRVRAALASLARNDGPDFFAKWTTMSQKNTVFSASPEQVTASGCTNPIVTRAATMSAASPALTIHSTAATIFSKAAPGNSFTGVVSLSANPPVAYIAPMQPKPFSKYDNTKYPLDKVVVGDISTPVAPFDHTPSSGTAVVVPGSTGLSGHHQICSHIAGGKPNDDNCIGFAVVRGATTGSETECDFSHFSNTANNAAFIPAVLTQTHKALMKRDTATCPPGGGDLSQAWAKKIINALFPVIGCTVLKGRDAIWAAAKQS